MMSEDFENLLSRMAKDQEAKMYEEISVQLELERVRNINVVNQLNAGYPMGARAPFHSTIPPLGGALSQQPFPPLTPPSPIKTQRIPAYVGMAAGSLVKCHSGHAVGGLVREALLGDLRIDDIDWVEGSILDNGSHFCPVCNSTSLMVDNEHFREQLLSSLLERLQAAGVEEAELIIGEFR